MNLKEMLQRSIKKKNELIGKIVQGLYRHTFDDPKYARRVLEVMIEQRDTMLKHLEE